jgi:peroxiredoxin family protein/TusA-related sulfurtransferase
VVVFCEFGVRAHVAARLLLNSGFKDVKVYPGGMRLYRLLFGDRIKDKGEATTMSTENVKTELRSTAAGAVAALRVDCSGMQCPGPIMKVFQTINAIEDGQAIEVIASDPGFVSDAGTWCRRTGNTLLGTEKRNGEYVVYIQKGVDDSARLISHAHTALPNGKSIIVFSGDLDKALASFIIANGAAAMGRRVTMFFTFWGLNILRRSEKKRVKKSFLEAMFGGMMPRGAKRAKLSKLNMLGMGTFMMKKVMRDKNVDMLEEMMHKAMQNGVKLIACTMSMDIMGIKAEELIDGIDYAGVATYLGEAEEADVNLFI